MAEQARPRRHRAAAAAMGAALAAAALVTAAPAAWAAPKCTVDFSSSDDHPAVGQEITLSWTTSGADQLVASWTSAPVPARGTQVTTKNAPGPVSYQVTGLKSGQYCGGAVVNVVFAAAVSSAPASTAPTTSPAPSTSSPPTTTAASTPASASPSVTYPAQSPTGGSSTPWYEQPLDLLVLGLLSLFGSLALFNRDRVRALLVRRH